MNTAVFAKVTHIGLDYATVELTAQITDSEHPENNYPSVEIEVPLAIGKWLEAQGAYDKQEAE